jgi:hypothetical protein
MYGFSGLHIDTGGGLISKDNIDLIAPLAEKGIRYCRKNFINKIFPAGLF